MHSVNLLDTPKRASLSARSIDLRATLKEWEKTHAAAHGGQKPGKDDIKADQDISKKYKEYSRLRDVLSGKLGLESLDEQKSPARPTKRVRADSAISLTPRKAHRSQGPHPNDLDPYDHPASASPQPAFLDAIGPTPQRDGRVLGLFDLLSRSGRSSQATPSAKKRKFDAIKDEGATAGQRVVAQTPSQRCEKNHGDFLEHLAGGGFESATMRKHSRTPASEGKKFRLSHFFATPTALRYAGLVEDPKDDKAIDPTPLRSMVLGQSPAKLTKADVPAVDATPAYLKRSFSFKDRLLSASNSSTSRPTDALAPGFTSPSAARRRPRPLQRSRSMPKPLSQIVQDLRKLEDEQHDDDMDALREIEGNSSTGVQISASEDLVNVSDADVVTNENNEAPRTAEPRVWKKRGQKRTTRRSVMRPALVKPKDAPKWVAPEEDGDEGEDRVEESQFVEAESSSSIYGDFSEDELALLAEHSQPHVRKSDVEQYLPEDGDPAVEGELDLHKPKRRRRKDTEKKPKTAKQNKGRKEEPSTEEKGRTINPNAYSHMNFRTLKIRNKNSKAKGGGRFGGKFGKGRR